MISKQFFGEWTTIDKKLPKDFIRYSGTKNFQTIFSFIIVYLFNICYSINVLYSIGNIHRSLKSIT
jgi:hypothetical protein